VSINVALSEYLNVSPFLLIGCTTKLNPLLKESFLLCQNLDSQGIYTRFSYAKSIIDETGLDILQLQNTTSSNQVKLPKKLGCVH
jgi:hypothetical protein